MLDPEFIPPYGNESLRRVRDHLTRDDIKGFLRTVAALNMINDNVKVEANPDTGVSISIVETTHHDSIDFNVTAGGVDSYRYDTREVCFNFSRTADDEDDPPFEEVIEEVAISVEYAIEQLTRP